MILFTAVCSYPVLLLLWTRLWWTWCCRKSVLCWASLRMELMELVSHFSSWEIVVPRNFMVDTGLLDIVRKSNTEGCLQKSTVISTVLSLLSSGCTRAPEEQWREDTSLGDTSTDFSDFPQPHLLHTAPGDLLKIRASWSMQILKQEGETLSGAWEGRGVYQWYDGGCCWWTGVGERSDFVPLKPAVEDTQVVSQVFVCLSRRGGLLWCLCGLFTKGAKSLTENLILQPMIGFSFFLSKSQCLFEMI